MANINEKNIRTRIEWEATAGQNPAGSPDKRPLEWGIAPKPMMTKTPISAMGDEYPRGYQSGLEWTDWTVAAGGGGQAFVGFGSINYFLESLFGTVSPTTVATGAYKRVYAPGSNPRTFALDHGDPAVLLQRYLHCFATGMTLAANLNTLTFGGGGKARGVISPATGAASAADIAIAKPNPVRGGLYLNTTYGSLGTPGDPAKIIAGSFVTGFRQFDLATGERFDTDTTIKPTNTSFDTYKALIPTGTASIILNGDSTGWGYLTQLRADQTIYGLYEVIGSKIAAGTAEVQTVDLSGTDDPTAGTWTLTIFGYTLVGLAWNISDTALQAEINSLPFYGAPLVTVSKTGFVYTITFPDILGNVAAVTTDNGVGFTGGGTYSIVVSTTTPGVAAFSELFAVEFAVQFSEHFDPQSQEGLRVLRFPFGLVQDANLTGVKFTTICNIPTL